MFYLVISTKTPEGFWHYLSGIFSSVSKSLLSDRLALSKLPEGPVADYWPIGMWVGDKGVALKFWSCRLQLLNDKEIFADDLGRELAKHIKFPMLRCVESDTKWGYEFHQAQQRSIFCVDKLYWPDDPAHCADIVADANALSELFGVVPERISRYLRIWLEVPLNDLKAYPTDHFECGDWEQVEDFIQTLIGGVEECYALELVAEEPDSPPKLRTPKYSLPRKL